MKLKELFPEIDIKSLKQPILMLFGLCIVYNIVYLAIQIAFYTQQTLFYGLLNGLSFFSSIGLYWFCLKTWNKSVKIDIASSLYVIGLQAIYIILIYIILLPLYNLLSSNSIGYIVIQVVSALLLFSMIPLQLLLYKGLGEGYRSIQEIKTYILAIVKENYRSLLNYYLSTLLIVILLDVLLGGQISSSGVANGMINSTKGTLDALSIVMNLLYVANPWVMFAVGILAIFVYQANILQAGLILIIYFGIGIGLSILEISYLQYVGNLELKKNKNGTKRTKANR